MLRYTSSRLALAIVRFLSRSGCGTIGRREVSSGLSGGCRICALSVSKQNSMELSTRLSTNAKQNLHVPVSLLTTAVSGFASAISSFLAAVSSLAFSFSGSDTPSRQQTSCKLRAVFLTFSDALTSNDSVLFQGLSLGDNGFSCSICGSRWNLCRGRRLCRYRCCRLVRHCSCALRLHGLLLTRNDDMKPRLKPARYSVR